jgi:hypothetical protein
LKGPSRNEEFNKHKKQRKNIINEDAVQHMLKVYGMASTPADTTMGEATEAMQEDTMRVKDGEGEHATNQLAQCQSDNLTGAHDEPRQEQ